MDFIVEHWGVALAIVSAVLVCVIKIAKALKKEELAADLQKAEDVVEKLGPKV